MPIKLTEEPDSLFVPLYRLAHRQQENFTTEALVHVLQELAVREPRIAVRFFDWLTDSQHFSERGAERPVSIRSQAWTELHGIPDIRLEAEDLDVIIEVKLDSGLTFSQAQAYATHLELKGVERRTLVALVGYPPAEEMPEGTVVRTWGELGQRLLKETEESDSPITRYLVEQLVGLLNHLHLIPLRVRSPISEALAAHRDWAKQNPELPSVMSRRVRSVARLAEMQHCEPLRNLLLQMDHALAAYPGVNRHYLDAGPHGVEPWIGFNINNGDYFFYVPLNEPEKVTLQRLGRGVDRSSFDGSLGYIEDGRRDGLIRWRVALDLGDPELAFFESDRTKQVRMLRDFFGRSFEFAKRLAPQPKVQ